MRQIVVIGGGAAGMMAAVQAARSGAKTVIFEKNEKLGKKLFITGKGRCNLTNACATADFPASVVSNPKFLYSALYQFTNYDVIDFFTEIGLKTKVERGERVFPASDKSSDVIRALENECKRQNVVVHLHSQVMEILTEGEEKEKRVRGVLLKDGSVYRADRVILAAGGVSYPGTGAAIQGMKLAKGHTITDHRPGLTGMLTRENTKKLQGLSCHICGLWISQEKKGGKKLFEERGELLFTHFGVSGPAVLTASSLIGDILAKREILYLHIDFKPWLTEEELDDEFLKQFDKKPNADIKKALGSLLPERLVAMILYNCGVLPEKKVNQLTKEDRRVIRHEMKDFVLTLTGLCDISEAIVTRGGIDVREVNPSTMESKIINGLYFAGEVLDLDALTGGFNLQIAWSTGCLAGRSASLI